MVVEEREGERGGGLGAACATSIVSLHGGLHCATRLPHVVSPPVTPSSSGQLATAHRGGGQLDTAHRGGGQQDTAHRGGGQLDTALCTSGWRPVTVHIGVEANWIQHCAHRGGGQSLCTSGWRPTGYSTVHIGMEASDCAHRGGGQSLCTSGWKPNAAAACTTVPLQFLIEFFPRTKEKLEYIIL